MEISKPILVAGGGIAGISAAIELAETGKNVVLIEKESYLGGNVIKMNNYFPKLCPPSCGLEINFRRIKNNPGINYHTNTVIQEISGEKGNFKVKLKTSAQFVNNSCTMCGKCLEVCPVEIPDKFNYSFGNTKAIHLSHEMAFPSKVTINTEACRKEECNKCVQVCEFNAIDFTIEDKLLELDVHSVILATGWKNYDAAKIDNLHYSEFEDVVTNVEFERLQAPNGPGKGKVLRPSDNKEPEEIAFVQCAGSRDENHLPYCSAVCCSASLKQALNLNARYPDVKIRIFYIDLRVSGRNEDFLKKVMDISNIELIKGKVGTVEKQANEGLFVEVEDILSGKKKKYPADLVVLAAGIVPQVPEIDIIKTKSGFIQAFQKEGVYAVASSTNPMDVSTSIKDATAAAIYAIQN